MGNVYNAMIDSPKKLAMIRPRDELLREELVRLTFLPAWAESTPPTPEVPAVTSPEAPETAVPSTAASSRS